MSVGIVKPGLLMGTPASQAVGNWYQQFLPNLGGRQIVDITFTDSLIGYAITSKVANISYLLKTTNKGDNWSIIYTDTDSNIFTCMNFLNTNTGFVGGYIRTGFSARIMKTTNGGFNWINVNTPMFTYQADMHVLNEDTIWFAMDELSSGGVFRTTNGGANWQVQYQGNNPGHIYMYDRNLGFISPPTLGATYRTTNSGINWVQIPGTDGFNDIKFVDSQTGWKASGFMRKTTNGGLNWVQQVIPFGGIISGSSIRNIHVLNNDTVWGVGGTVEYPNLQTRGIIFRTVNGGNNWQFQIPDTTIHVFSPYSYIQFLDAQKGWAYSLLTGIHTTTGGDTEWITGITQISSEVPKDFMLYQNYPNPFNPKTNIKYSVMSNVKGQMSNVKLIIFDIQGKLITELVNQWQNAGTYEVDWNASGYSSGIYFYKLTVTTAKEVFTDTKKMVLVK